MKTIPKKARLYFLGAALMFALPSLFTLYKGYDGKFIVATGKINDAVFGGTVIYITYHDLGGASGVIINKDIEPETYNGPKPEEVSWKVDLKYGGPVAFGKNNSLQLPDTNEPTGFLVAPVDDVRRFHPVLALKLRDGKLESRPRLYLGYAGWTLLQLDSEIAKGYWGVIDYDPDLMFNTPREKIWEKAMEKVLESAR